MALTFQVEQEEGYLHVVATGENAPENIFEYLMKVREACTQRKCPVVLIEENLKGPSLDLKKIFDVVSLSSEHAERDVKRIAYVDVNPEHEFIKNEFGVNVAVGLGIDVRIFHTVEEARQWLIAQAASSAPLKPKQTHSA